MLRTKLLSLATAALFTAAVSAQVNCSDNLYPLHLVDQNGVAAPKTLDPATGRFTYHFSSEAVYLAFDPTLASGTYYVHVTSDKLEEVASTNDPMDRFVSVTNSGGVISLSLPYTDNQDPAVFGLGLGGQGQSILLKFRSSEFSPCRWKALIGDKWDLTNGSENPFLLDGGIHPVSGLCAVRSYDGFTIGDGNGSEVTGKVFRDEDRDGVRDAGEGGLANWQVRLTNTTSSVTATTDANGHYSFAAVPAGEYSVELVLQNGYIVTTAASHSIVVCDCADLEVNLLGAAVAMLPCNARTIGYWRNHHGLCKVQQFQILQTLPALHIVNMCGQYVAPGNIWSFKCWLQMANSWNMAYMLSAQLVAMHCNVMVGFVHPDCVINDPCLGQMTIAQLMQQAVASLCAHRYTPPCSPHRHAQSLLKNALDRANNNLIWQ